MEIFTNTVGHSPSSIAAFIKWVLTFVVILFGVFVIKGTYVRWINGDSEGTDVLIDVVVAVAITTWVSIIIE